MWHFGIETSRRGMGDVTRHHNARFLALLGKDLKQGLYGNRVGIHAHHSVSGLVVAGQSRTTRRRVGDVVAGRVCIHNADVRELGENQFLTGGQHAGIDLRQSRTVTDEINDVQCFRRFLRNYFFAAEGGQCAQKYQGKKGVKR